MVTTLHTPARTWTDGNADLTAALENQELRDNFNFLQAVPFCRVSITTLPVVVATGVDTLLAWTRETDDLDGMHDNVTNNSRITVPTAGVYRVHVALYISTGVNCIHDIKLMKNGVITPYEYEATFASAAANDYRFHLYWYTRCAANDYLEAKVFQNSGGNVNLSADGAGDTPFFEVRWVRV